MTLSLCIPTFNEAKNVHYPLDSCIDWVDEVVIIDGGSSDGTVDLVKRYGKKVRVFEVDNPPNFLLNKQRAIERAKGDWILQLDADEEVSERLKCEILSTLQREEQKDGYWIPRKNLFLGRFLMKGGVYPDRVLRLYKRSKAYFELKHVHEHAKIDGEVGELNAPLEHYADPEFGRYLKRWVRYNKLDVKLLAEQGAAPSFFQYCFWKPASTFVSMFGRHKGFMDGWQGFVFAFFSSIRYIDIYLRYRRTTPQS